MKPLPRLLPVLASLLFCFFAGSQLYSQVKVQYENSWEAIVKGYKYKQNGEYEQALTEYEKVHEGDTNFFPYALPEKMSVYALLENYEKVKELGDEYWFFRHKLPTEFYLSYGTALDQLEKYEEAQSMYRQLLKEFPLNYSLWYNYGVSLKLDEKYDEAWEVFQKTIEVNPLYDRVHLQIADLALRQQHTAKGLMALNMYLTLGGTNRNTFNTLSYANSIANSKYWSEDDYEEITGVDIGSNGEYSTIDELLHNYAAIDKKYKTGSKLDFDLIKQTHLLIESINEFPEKQGDFWHDNYIWFYKKMKSDDMFEDWSYLISSYVTNDKMKRIISRKSKNIDGALSWSHKAIDIHHRNVDLSFIDLGKVKVLRNEEKNYYTYALGDFEYTEGSDNIRGDVTFYNQAGRVSAKGTFDDDYKRHGNWKFYFPNGYLKEEISYDHGTAKDSGRVYEDNGLIKYELNYADGKIHGDIKIYDKGILDRILPYTHGEVDEGLFTKFHTIGAKSYSYNLKGGNAHGPYKSYYNTGDLRAEGTYDEGNYTGERKVYFRDGKLSYLEHYEDGEKNGEYESYYSDGQLHTKGIYVKGNKSGDWKTYHRDGKISMEQSFDENGKLTGHEKKYTLDGVLLYDKFFKKGELEEYTYFDKDGNALVREETKRRKLNFKALYHNGQLEEEGVIEKSERHGEWKTYYTNGALETVKTYDEGKLKGEYKKYLPNGEIEINYPYNKQGEATGYYTDRFRNKNIYRQGYLKDGSFNGPWKYYTRDGEESSSMFYIEGDKNGFARYRTKSGIMTRTEYIEKGDKKFTVYHDSNGAPLDTLFHIPAVTKKTLRACKACPIYFEVPLKNNVYHGTATYYWPNDQISAQGEYFEGNQNGIWKGYHVNGKLQYEGEYNHGDKHGVWKYYHDNGELKEIYNYLNGKLNGERKSFNKSGEITFNANYRHENLHGDVKYYIGAKNDHTRDYYDGVLMSYTYKKNGKTITVPVENESVKAEITWDNGKTARIFTLENGYLQNEYIKYFQNGKMYSKVNYQDDWLHGEYYVYHPNGNIKEDSKLNYGRLTVEQILLHSNGEVYRQMPFVRGSRHGTAKYYDENGALTETRVYFNGTLIEIK